MKIVLAFEGMDGAGKTSLAMFARKLSEEHGRRFTLIGRRESYATPLVGRLTRVLHEEARTLSPTAESLLRLARDYERACLAAATRSEVVLLDRFVLSTLALVRFYGQEVDALFRPLHDIIVRAQLRATVFVTCNFETARKRVRDRSANQPPRRSRDDRVLRRLAEFMEQDFWTGTLTGQQWPVDNSKALEAAEEQLAAYLLPYVIQSPQPRADGPTTTPPPSSASDTLAKVQHETV
jgi:thymidylate kinase